MKILLKFAAALVCLGLLPSVVTYYISEDNPNIGFIAVSKGHGSYKNGITGVQRKLFTRQNVPGYLKSTNEEIVDSHFKVMKTADFHLTNAIYDKKFNQEVEVSKKTVSPHQQRHVREESSDTPDYMQNKIPAKNQHTKENLNDIKQVSTIPIYPRDGNRESHKSHMYANNYPISQADSNPKSMDVNVHKAQVPAAPQKVRLNVNRHLAGLQVPNNYYEKSMQRPSGRNAQLMSQMLDSMSAKHLKEISSKRSLDSKKELLTQTTIEGIGLRKKNNPPADKTEILLDHRSNSHDVNTQNGMRNDEPGRIGSRGAGLEINPTPYAVFYRMNPEIMDREVGFIPFVNEKTNDKYTYSNKKKRLTENYVNHEGIVPKAKSTNSVQVLKRVKGVNVSNYKKV